MESRDGWGGALQVLKALKDQQVRVPYFRRAGPNQSRLGARLPSLHTL